MYSFPDAAKALKTTLFLPDDKKRWTGASIDTRTLRAGEIFVALKGTQSDGHQFLAGAFQQGAAGALIDEEFFYGHSEFLKSKNLFCNLMPVTDPASALLDLAVWHRKKFSLPVAGITGSYGKTSTKEMLAYLLRKKKNILATEGNLNNHLGLPLTLLKLQDVHECCVAELGANHPGEIELLARRLQPTVGILTGISEAHLGGFGSLEEIYTTKLGLLKSLPSDGVAVLPDHDPVLIKRAERFNKQILLAGVSAKANYRLDSIECRQNRLSFRVNRKYSFTVPVPAEFFAQNAGLAIAAAESLGVPIQEMPSDWQDFVLPGGRFEIHHFPEDKHLIHDGYNANPYSFEKSLDAFMQIKEGRRKILVLGDMLELGHQAEALHRKLGEKIARCPLAAVLGVGPLASFSLAEIKQSRFSGEILQFQDLPALTEALQRLLMPGDWVLLKASHGMNFEKIIETFKSVRTVI